MRKIEDIYEATINEASGLDPFYEVLAEIFAKASGKQQDQLGSALEQYIIKYPGTYKKLKAIPFAHMIFDMVWQYADYIPMDAEEQGLL